MTREELIDHLEHLERYTHYSEDAPALREVIEMLKCSEMPNSSEERTQKRTETHACDCISREAAIVQVNKVIWDDAVAHDVKEVLKELPSTQLEVRTQMSSADCISRQAAIDALHDEIVRRRINEDSNDDGALDEFDTEAILRRLPSAQPEIIHCRECRNWINHCCYERKHIKTGFYTSGNKYCAWAERREE